MGLISYIWHNVWSRAFLIGVIGNLIASALWAAPVIRSLHRKLDRHHKEHMAQIAKLNSGTGNH